MDQNSVCRLCSLAYLANKTWCGELARDARKVEVIADVGCYSGNGSILLEYSNFVYTFYRVDSVGWMHATAATASAGVASGASRVISTFDVVK
ncbi:hypothetical protein M0802_007480 [Mischocyttarus mexicanus]|nr:hypothetical protein M0802_007480 [Mischocyttarus mexicanus]